MKSPYSDQDYLRFVQLQARFAGPSEPQKSRHEALGFDRTLARSQELDRELAEVGRPKAQSQEAIEKLVAAWREQKQVLGVRDSDTEARVQVGFCE